MSANNGNENHIKPSLRGEAVERHDAFLLQAAAQAGIEPSRNADTGFYHFQISPEELKR